jgi:translation initiation factor 4G
MHHRNQRDDNRHPQHRHENHNMHPPKSFNQNYNNNNNNNNNNGNINNINSNAKELAPRFKRNLVTTTTTPSVDDLQMRPPQNSLLFKASNINKPNPQQLPMNQNNRSGTSSPGLGANNPPVDNLIPAFNSNVLVSNGNSQPVEVSKASPTPQNQPSSPQKSEVVAVTKQGSIEKPKAKKDKGPSRDDVLKKVSQFLSETLFNKSFMDEIKEDPIKNGHTNGKIIEECIEVKEEVELNEENSIKSLDDVVKLYYDLKVPEKFLKDAIVKILNESLDKGDQIHEISIDFLMSMQKDKKLTANQLTDALRTVINGMSEREKTIPKVTTHVASLLARSMIKKICKLNDIANFTLNGQHYPLLLLVLQQLHKTIGDEQLIEVFNVSKVNLMSSLPECDRTKERLAEILDDRKLSFLQPLLRIESELWRQIKEDPQPQTFYKWIKDNVDPIRYTDPGFITALMTVILRFITQVRFYFLNFYFY